MMVGVIATRDNTAAWQRGVWRSAATLLVFAIGVHQLVMAAPALHMAAMPMPDAMAAMHRQGATDCPLPCPVPLTGVCPALQAALPHPSGGLIFFLLFALIAPPLAPPMPARARRRMLPHGRLWPPGRRRAFLQVFLC